METYQAPSTLVHTLVVTDGLLEPVAEDTHKYGACRSDQCTIPTRGNIHDNAQHHLTAGKGKPDGKEQLLL